MKKIGILFLISGLYLLTGVQSQTYGQNRGIVRPMSDDISLGIGGTIQPRVTYASDDPEDRVRFGIRRLRLRVYTGIGDNLGIFLQMEGSGTPTWSDIRGEYRLNDNVTLRAGRFVGAQPRAFARTSHAAIDAVDRPAISEMWARMTVGADGRDYGVETLWNTPHWELRGFLHNGCNRSNFRSGISNVPATGGIETDGFAFSAAATHWPSARDEWELGVYASVNTAKNANTAPNPDVLSGMGRNYVSYSAQAYWGALPGSQPYRVKADVIGISYQEIEPFGMDHYLGGSLFGAVLAAPELELFAMGEYWHADRGTEDDLARVFARVGGSYSFSAGQGRPFHLNRIIFSYCLRSGDSESVNFDDPAHVIMIQSQFYF